jgi:hypothetical protein|tara:strand:- start:574 stop:1971 length:1398 start_codon:yes stop_codon:yes gene_type:complete
MAAYTVSSCLTIQVYALFGKNPFAKGSKIDSDWSDITDYVMDFKTKSGRANYVVDFPPSMADITLKNQDRRFDPTFTTGAYAASGKSNVKVGVRIRIIGNYTNGAGTKKLALYDGHAIDWKQKFINNGTVLVCKLKCADRLFLAQNYRYIASRGAETPVARYVNILPALSASADSSDYVWQSTANYDGTGFASSNTVPAKTYDESALTALRQIAISAVTNFKMSASGMFTWFRLPRNADAPMSDSRTRYNGYVSLVTLDPTESLPPTASSTGIAYQSVRFSSNLGKVVNEVRFAPEGTTTFQTAQNTDDFKVFGVQSLSYSQQLYNTTAIAKANASVLMNAMRDADILVDQVSVVMDTKTYIPAADSAWDKFIMGIIGEETDVSVTDYTGTYVVDYNTLTVSIPMPDSTTQTVTGLRAGLELSLNRIDKRFIVKINIEPLALARVWVLGKTGFSELGESTVLTIP